MKAHSADLIVADLPYGVVHNNGSARRAAARRAARCGWSCCDPGGALGMSWNTHRRAARASGDAAGEAGLKVLEGFDGFAHWVDQANHRATCWWLASQRCDYLACTPEPRSSICSCRATPLLEGEALLRAADHRGAAQVRGGVAEVGALDLHGRAEIGVAVVAPMPRHVAEVLDACERLVAGRPEVELLSVRRRWHGDDD